MNVNEPKFQHDASDRCDYALIPILRSQTPAQKLAVLASLWRSACAFVTAGVRTQHPDWSDSAVAKEVARRISHGACGQT